jgi:hypothetical protein
MLPKPTAAPAVGHAMGAFGGGPNGGGGGAAVRNGNVRKGGGGGSAGARGGGGGDGKVKDGKGADTAQRLAKYGSYAHSMMQDKTTLLNAVKALQSSVRRKFGFDVFRGGLSEKVNGNGSKSWEPTLPLTLTSGSFKKLEVPTKVYPGSDFMGLYHFIGDALGTAELTELSPIGKLFMAESGKGTRWCLGYAKLVRKEDLTK